MSARVVDKPGRDANRIHVPIGGTAVGAPPTELVTMALGSCVAVVLYHPSSRVGALAHVLLPERLPTRTPASPGRSMDTAVPHLLNEMLARGARVDGTLVAKLVGGATMFGALLREGGVGERNIAAARALLTAHRIPIVGEDVGREHGRSVFFHLDDGRVMVQSLRVGTHVL